MRRDIGRDIRRDIGRDIRREGKKAALLFFLLAFLSGCGREESRIRLPEVMRVMKLMEAVHRSAETGEIIKEAI